MNHIDKYTLSDGHSFSIAPDWGCNLVSWIVDGNELMYCPDDLPETATKITGGGNPILFPAVGRTWDHSSGEPVPGNYKIYGSDKNYYMPSHGIVFLCKWRKIEESRADDKITVSYKMIVPDSVWHDNFPFDLGLTQRYTLTPNTIELEAVITNNGSVPAPAAFGYHPYFKVSNPQREGVEVRLQVSKHLLLTEKTVLLTGETEGTDGIVKMRAGVYYDNVYGSPTGQRMSLIDQKAGHAIHVDYDDTFELFLVYSPDDSDFVCIEPWTRGLGAYEHLREMGWENGEYIPVLKPGEVSKHKAIFSRQEQL